MKQLEQLLHSHSSREDFHTYFVTRFITYYTGIEYYVLKNDNITYNCKDKRKSQDSLFVAYYFPCHGKNMFELNQSCFPDSVSGKYSLRLMSMVVVRHLIFWIS